MVQFEVFVPGFARSEKQTAPLPGMSEACPGCPLANRLAPRKQEEAFPC
jgi:hypothetical protein